MIPHRLEKLREILSASDYDGIVLNAGTSLNYFTGLDFHLMERPVFFLYTPDTSPVLILPRLEAAKVDGLDSIDTFFYDENPLEWTAIVAKGLHRAKMQKQRLGVEPLGLRYLEFSMLNEAADLSFGDCSKIIASLRSRKDESEIASMQQAVTIAENALKATLPQIRRGMKEKEIASELVIQLFKNGSDPKLPFSPIVSAGPHGANPHAKPSTRKIEEGDMLVIDWGASYDGYVSDLTRTFAVGTIDEQAVAIHECVQQANSAGRKAGKPGIPCCEVDIAAREVIESAGYGEFFTHRTGHGIGKECHEEPYMHAENQQLLEKGMSYTVEPGIYIPGRNGVRIEDDVVVTENGAKSLSTLPRKIIQVG